MFSLDLYLQPLPIGTNQQDPCLKLTGSKQTANTHCSLLEAYSTKQSLCMHWLITCWKRPINVTNTSANYYVKHYVHNTAFSKFTQEEWLDILAWQDWSVCMKDAMNQIVQICNFVPVCIAVCSESLDIEDTSTANKQNFVSPQSDCSIFPTARPGKLFSWAVTSDYFGNQVIG